MTGDRKVLRYVAAARELATLKKQREEFPELAEVPTWKVQYTAALVEQDTAFRALTGGQLARAQRLIGIGRPRW